MLTKEVTRLRDRDVRQRRKAVRRLFEDGDPGALPHFMPFLNDSDEWFVNRAMLAIERWYDGLDPNIPESLSNSEKEDRRLLAARVAIRMESPKKMLARLTEDADVKVRIAAWTNLVKFDPDEAFRAIESKDTAVRRIGVESLFGSGNVDELLLARLMSDPSSSVRLSISKIISMKPDSDNLKRIYTESGLSEMKAADASQAIRESALIALQTPWIQDYLSSENPKQLTALAPGIRESEWLDHEEAVETVMRLASDRLLERILRKGRGEKIESACLRVLKDSRRSASCKTRIVLDRIGRRPSAKFVESILSLGIETEGELGSAVSMLVDDQSGIRGRGQKT